MGVNWKAVRYFKEEEFEDPKFPGSGKLIDGRLLFLLDKLREETGWPVVIHTSVGGAVDINGSWGHARGSYHLKANGCKAVEFHFKTKVSLREQYNRVCRMGFGGVGMYPDWNSPGFHVDLRSLDRTQHWVARGGTYKYFLKDSDGSKVEPLGESKKKGGNDYESMADNKVDSSDSKATHTGFIERLRRYGSRFRRGQG